MGHCQNCRKDIATNFDLHTLHCVKFLDLCKKCDEPIPRTEMDEHLREDHKKIFCSKGCGVAFEKYKEEDHQASCQHRVEKCMYCDLEDTLHNLVEHIKACGARTEKCAYCEKYIMVSKFEEHERLHLDWIEKVKSNSDKNGPVPAPKASASSCPPRLITRPLSTEKNMESPMTKRLDRSRKLFETSAASASGIIQENSKEKTLTEQPGVAASFRDQRSRMAKDQRPAEKVRGGAVFCRGYSDSSEPMPKHAPTVEKGDNSGRKSSLTTTEIAGIISSTRKSETSLKSPSLKKENDGISIAGTKTKSQAETRFGCAASADGKIEGKNEVRFPQSPKFPASLEPASRLFKDAEGTFGSPEKEIISGASQSSGSGKVKESFISHRPESIKNGDPSVDGDTEHIYENFSPGIQDAKLCSKCNKEIPSSLFDGHLKLHDQYNDFTSNLESGKTIEKANLPRAITVTVDGQSRIEPAEKTSTPVSVQTRNLTSEKRSQVVPQPRKPLSKQPRHEDQLSNNLPASKPVPDEQGFSAETNKKDGPQLNVSSGKSSPGDKVNSGKVSSLPQISREENGSGTHRPSQSETKTSSTFDVMSPGKSKEALTTGFANGRTEGGTSILESHGQSSSHTEYLEFLASLGVYIEPTMTQMELDEIVARKIREQEIIEASLKPQKPSCDFRPSTRPWLEDRTRSALCGVQPWENNPKGDSKKGRVNGTAFRNGKDKDDDPSKRTSFGENLSSEFSKELPKKSIVVTEMGVLKPEKLRQSIMELKMIEKEKAWGYNGELDSDDDNVMEVDVDEVPSESSQSIGLASSEISKPLPEAPGFKTLNNPTKPQNSPIFGTPPSSDDEDFSAQEKLARCGPTNSAKTVIRGASFNGKNTELSANKDQVETKDTVNRSRSNVTRRDAGKPTSSEAEGVDRNGPRTSGWISWRNESFHGSKPSGKTNRADSTTSAAIVNKLQAADKNDEEVDISDMKCDKCLNMVPWKNFTTHVTMCPGPRNPTIKKQPKRPKSPVRHFTPHRNKWVEDSEPVACCYCKVEVPSNNIFSHEANCKMKANRRASSFDTPSPSSSGSRYAEEEFVQCEICSKMVAIKKLNEHEIVCLYGKKPQVSTDVGSPRGFRPKNLKSSFSYLHASSSSAVVEDETKIPCEFCEQQLPLTKVHEHQFFCPAKLKPFKNFSKPIAKDIPENALQAFHTATQLGLTLCPW